MSPRSEDQTSRVHLEVRSSVAQLIEELKRLCIERKHIGSSSTPPKLRTRPPEAPAPVEQRKVYAWSQCKRAPRSGHPEKRTTRCFRLG
jgi:hypothetical protein